MVGKNVIRSNIYYGNFFEITLKMEVKGLVLMKVLSHPSHGDSK